MFCSTVLGSKYIFKWYNCFRFWNQLQSVFFVHRQSEQRACMSGTYWREICICVHMVFFLSLTTWSVTNVDYLNHDLFLTFVWFINHFLSSLPHVLCSTHVFLSSLRLEFPVWSGRRASRNLIFSLCIFSYVGGV